MFKALFCLQGIDTRARFLIINSIAWALLFILCVLLDESLFFYLLILIPALVLYACVVRVSDKRPPEPLYYVLPFAFVLGALACGLLSPIWALLPLVLSLPLWVQLARMASLSAGSEECDYNHFAKPATKSEKQRVEPTFGSNDTIEQTLLFTDDLATQANEQNYQADIVKESHRDDHKFSSTPISTAQQLKRIFDDLHANVLANPKLYIATLTAAVILLLTIILSTWLSESSHLASPIVTQKAETRPIASQVEYEINLPDGFSLALVDKKLSINWLGDADEQAEIWSLASGKGDKRCSELVFDDGSAYRPVKVVMTNKTITQAWFSPLDAKMIIQDIARLGHAKLCGYHFSLKGTRALLEGHHVFSSYLK